MQLAPLRGAAVAPEPYREPSREPPAPAREGPHAAEAAGGGGGPVGEFFAALGPDWRLTAAQRVKLAPAVTAALNAGWTPQALAAFAGANISGVRNPYAVLVTHLSATRLAPPPPGQRPFRPPGAVSATSGPVGERISTERTLGAARPAIRWPTNLDMADQRPIGRVESTSAGALGATGSDGAPMPTSRPAKARHGPGRRDSVRPSAYHGTRVRLPEG